MTVEGRLPSDPGTPPGPSTRPRRLPCPRISVADKNCSPRASGDILQIIRAAATTHHLARPVPMTTCITVAFGIAFGSSARVYRPRSPASPRRSRFDPRGNLREHQEAQDPESKTEGQIKAWCQVGRKRSIGIMICGAKDNGAGAE